MLTELGTRQFFSFATMKNLTNFSNLFVPLIWESIGYFTFADASWWSWNWDSSLWSQWEETQAWTCSCLGASHTPPHTDVHCTVPSKDCQHFWGNVWTVFGWQCERKQQTEQGILKRDNDLLHDIGWLFNKSIFFSAWVYQKMLAICLDFKKIPQASRWFTRFLHNCDEYDKTESYWNA